MINVDKKIKQAYEISTTQIDKIILEGKEYRITNVNYYDDCYEDGNVFGTAIARSLEFEIENIVDLEKKEIEYLTGIKIDNKIEWISLGKFIIQDVEPNDTTNINKVVSMDYMLKTNTIYASKLDYTSNKITILDVLQEVCNSCGLELETKKFANSNFIVDSNQFSENTLNRQVIQAVSQISGTFAKIKNDNKLYLITPKMKGLLVKDVHSMPVEEFNMLPVEKLSVTDNQYSMSNYKELTIKRNTHPINLVSLGMNDIEGENIVLRDEISIKENGENSLVINDNPFAYTQEKREKLIIALFDVVKGFSYTSFEIQGQAKPYLETGDEIAVIDRDGTVASSFLFRFNYKSPNGLESEMSAPSIIKATVNYQNIPSALEIAKRTEIIVDKQEGKITQLVEKNAEHSKKLTKHEQDINSIKDSVSHIENLTREIDGITTITLNDCTEGKLLELHILGNNTVFEYLYPNDELYPEDNLYPYGDSRIVVTDSNNNQKIYELGIMDVLRQNSEAYDEYILEKGQAKVIRRVNKDGTTKTKETIEDLGEFEISLKEGTNKITIQNYTARLKAKWAIKSDYTDIFATRVEMNSSINQTAQEINIEVKKKVDENEIISKINQSAEQIGIEANKINLKRKSIEFI